MNGMKEEVISAWADVDIEIGDAIYFSYYNFASEVTPPGAHAMHPYTSGSTFRTIHGVAITSGATGELVSVRLGTSTTIDVRCTWTGDLTPGTAVFPGTVTGALTTDDAGVPSNQLGIYVGADVIPDTYSGAMVEIMISRVTPHIDL